MTTYGWSYRNNHSGSKPGALLSNIDKQDTDSVPGPVKRSSATKDDRLKHRGSSASRLYVGGISWKTTEAELKHYFSAFGEVVDIRIIADKETGFSRGFGFVTFESRSEAETCKKWCAGHSPMLGDRLIRVDYAERHSDKTARDRDSKRGADACVQDGGVTMTLRDGTVALTTQPADVNQKVQSSTAAYLAVDRSHWQYKWTVDAQEAYGPYTTSQVQGWVDGKFFSKGVVVREVDPYQYNEVLRAGSAITADTFSNDFLPIGDVDFAMFP